MSEYSIAFQFCVIVYHEGLPTSYHASLDYITAMAELKRIAVETAHNPAIKVECEYSCYDSRTLLNLSPYYHIQRFPFWEEI